MLLVFWCIFISMREFELAIEKGYTYNPTTGKVYGIKGREIKGKTSDGYIMFSFKVDGKQYSIYGHRFAYYCVYKQINNQIDHINGNRTDNRINNLRSVTSKQNHWNRTTAKGYQTTKNGKYFSEICVDGKSIYLGTFDTQEEAERD